MGMFPEIEITVKYEDGEKVVIMARLAAIMKTERKFNIDVSQVNERMEYLLFLTYTQLQHDKYVLKTFDRWAMTVANLGVVEIVPNLDEEA